MRRRARTLNSPMAPKPNPPRPKGDGKAKPPAATQPSATAQSKKNQDAMSDGPSSMAGARRGREALAAEPDAVLTTPPDDTESPATAQPPATPSQLQNPQSGPSSPSHRPHKHRPSALSPASQQPVSNPAPPPHAPDGQQPPEAPEPSEGSTAASLTEQFAHLVPTSLSDAVAPNVQSTTQPAVLDPSQAPPDARAASSPSIFQATISNTGSQYATMADRLRMAAIPGHVATATGPPSAKHAAEMRVSGAPTAPAMYRHPPGTSGAIRIDPAVPAVLSASERQPTPQEAADLFLEEQAQRQRDVALRRQGKQPAPPQQPPAAPESSDEPPPLAAADAMEEEDPSQLMPPPPVPPQRIRRTDPTQPPRPHPQVSVSILIARQRWLGYIHHRLPPPPPLIWAWGIINPDMIDD